MSDRTATLSLINDHRVALGRRRYSMKTADAHWPGAKLEKELRRVEKCAEYGNDPWSHVDGKDRAAPPA